MGQPPVDNSRPPDPGSGGAGTGGSGLLVSSLLVGRRRQSVVEACCEFVSRRFSRRVKAAWQPLVWVGDVVLPSSVPGRVAAVAAPAGVTRPDAAAAVVSDVVVSGRQLLSAVAVVPPAAPSSDVGLVAAPGLPHAAGRVVVWPSAGGWAALLVGPSPLVDDRNWLSGVWRPSLQEGWLSVPVDELEGLPGGWPASAVGVVAGQRLGQLVQHPHSSTVGMFLVGWWLHMLVAAAATGGAGEQQFELLLAFRPDVVVPQVTRQEPGRLWEVGWSVVSQVAAAAGDVGLLGSRVQVVPDEPLAAALVLMEGCHLRGSVGRVSVERVWQWTDQSVVRGCLARLLVDGRVPQPVAEAAVEVARRFAVVPS